MAAKPSPRAGPDQVRAGDGSPSAVQSAWKACPGPGSTEMLTIRGAAAGGSRRNTQEKAKRGQSSGGQRKRQGAALPGPFAERVGGGSGDRIGEEGRGAQGARASGFPEQLWPLASYSIALGLSFFTCKMGITYLVRFWGRSDRLIHVGCLCKCFLNVIITGSA